MNEEAISSEQEALDKHDKEIDTFSIRLEQLLGGADSPSNSGEERTLSQNLASLERSLRAVCEGLSPDEDDPSLLQHYQEELIDLKTELIECCRCLNRLNLSEEHELTRNCFQLKTDLFDACHKINNSKLLTLPTQPQKQRV